MPYVCYTAGSYRSIIVWEPFGLDLMLPANYRSDSDTALSFWLGADAENI